MAFIGSSEGSTPAGQQSVVFQNTDSGSTVQITAYDPLMVGDTGSGGTAGNVPAPGAGDAAAEKFLKADGTWSAPPGTGGTGLFAGVLGTLPTRSGIGLTTAYNQSGSLIISDSSAGITLMEPDSQSDDFYIEGVLGSYPTSPFTLNALISAPPLPQSYAGTGLVIADTTTGLLYYFDFVFTGSWMVQLNQANTPTSFNDTVYQAEPINCPYLWLQIVDDGTTVSFNVGTDGVTWMPIGAAITKSSSFLGASGFNYLGFAIQPQAVGLGSSLMSWNITR